MKSFFVLNLGCAKNRVDGYSIAALLEESGMQEVEDASRADLVILNSCAFIESSREESINAFFELEKARKPGSKLVLAGCLPQRYNADLAKELTEADALLGNYDLDAAVPEMLATLGSGPKPDKRVFGVADFACAASEPFDVPHRSSRFIAAPSADDTTASVYVKIAEGCCRRCSFCAIPLIRGRLVSVPQDEVVLAVEKAVSHGAREINLIAQDLMSYGADADGKTHLPELLDSLLNVGGDFRIRLLYMHPDFFTSDVIRAVRESRGRILPYFDIPLQHADAGILSSMGRKGDSETYLSLIKSIRDALPDSVVRSTFLLGFPGETRETLETLREFIMRAELDYSGFFAYSREEGTRAHSLRQSDLKRGFIGKKIKEFSALQEEISSGRFARFAGRRMEAMVEGEAEGSDGFRLYIARVFAQAPDVDGITSVKTAKEHVPGDIVNVEITGSFGYDLDAVEVP